MTSYGPFAERTPRGQDGWIDEAFRTGAEHLRLMLGSLDGEEKFTYIVWRGDDPTNIVGFGDEASESLMQAAGSAEAMTVEVRLPGSDGEHHLYTVGRPEPADGTTTLIPMSDDRAVRVFSNEIFTADEAAAIFYMFYLSEVVSEPYVLRELDLARDLSELR